MEAAADPSGDSSAAVLRQRSTIKRRSTVQREQGFRKNFLWTRSGGFDIPPASPLSPDPISDNGVRRCRGLNRQASCLRDEPLLKDHIPMSRLACTMLVLVSCLCALPAVSRAQESRSGLSRFKAWKWKPSLPKVFSRDKMQNKPKPTSRDFEIGDRPRRRTFSRDADSAAEKSEKTRGDRTGSMEPRTRSSSSDRRAPDGETTPEKPRRYYTDSRSAKDSAGDRSFDSRRRAGGSQMGAAPTADASPRTKPTGRRMPRSLPDSTSENGRRTGDPSRAGDDEFARSTANGRFGDFNNRPQRYGSQSGIERTGYETQRPSAYMPSMQREDAVSAVSEDSSRDDLDFIRNSSRRSTVDAASDDRGPRRVSGTTPGASSRSLEAERGRTLSHTTRHSGDGDSIGTSHRAATPGARMYAEGSNYDRARHNVESAHNLSDVDAARSADSRVFQPDRFTPGKRFTPDEPVQPRNETMISPERRTRVGGAYAGDPEGDSNGGRRTHSTHYDAAHPLAARPTLGARPSSRPSTYTTFTPDGRSFTGEENRNGYNDARPPIERLPVGRASDYGDRDAAMSRGTSIDRGVTPAADIDRRTPPRFDQYSPAAGSNRFGGRQRSTADPARTARESTGRYEPNGRRVEQDYTPDPDAFTSPTGDPTRSSVGDEFSNRPQNRGFGGRDRAAPSYRDDQYTGNRPRTR